MSALLQLHLHSQHLVPMHWTKTTARRGEKHLSFGNWCDFTRGFTVYQKDLAYLWTILVIYTFYNLTMILLFQIIFGLCTNVYNTSKVNCLSTKERVHDDVIKWEIFRVTGLCVGNLTVTGDCSSQRTRNFDVFLYLCLNKRLSKPSRRR